MPESAPSYVERAADRQLLNALLEGKFCYVLNSRQMGKSSLCVRVKNLLAAKGVACAFVDLTRIGGQNLTPEQWYAGILGEIGRSLGLRTEFLAYWKDHIQESPMQRVFGALRDVALAKNDGLVTVFIDEVDAARSLPFNADEFLTGIRECYNRRAHDPSYNQLTFCLLGAAIPSDLIRDAKTTPFNIGERIYLRDFTREEASVLAKGLGVGREKLLDRINYWTNGHPFLTQSLCTAVEHDASIHTDEDVNALVKRDLLEPKARETNINLADVGNRVLNGYVDGDDVDKFRADILSAYEKSLSGRTVLVDDESNRVTAVLKLSGLMRSEGKSLKVRNPIYERVFGRDWIKENMPGQEVRRQKRAFWIGVIRTALIAAMVIALVANLAYRNNQLRVAADKARDAEAYEVYVADMNLMSDLWNAGDLDQMNRLLQANANNPARGWEWSLWSHLDHQAKHELDLEGGFGVEPSFDGKTFIARLGDGYGLYDSATFKQLAKWSTPDPAIGRVILFPDGKRCIESSTDGNAYVRDSYTGKLIKAFQDGAIVNMDRAGNWGVGYDAERMPVLFDLQKFTATHIRTAAGIGQAITPDGRHFAFGVLPIGAGAPPSIDIRSVPSTREEITLQPESASTVIVFSPDGKYLYGGTIGGMLECWDWANKKRLWTKRAQTDELEDVSVSQDGRTVVTCGRERFAHVYSVSTSGAKLINTYPDAGYAFLSPTGDIAYVGYWTLRAYDIHSGDASPLVHLTHGPYVGALILPSGQTFIANFTAHIEMGNLLTDRVFGPQDDTPPGVFAGGFHHAWAFLSTPDGQIKIFDPTQGNKIIATLPIHVPRNPGWTESRDGKFLLALGTTTAEIWDITSGQRISSIALPAVAEYASWSHSGKTIAIGFSTGSVGLLDVASSQMRLMHVHRSPVETLDFFPDDKTLLSGSDDDTAATYDVASAKPLNRFIGHSQSVMGCAVSPDGKRCATAAQDGTARIWDAQTGRQLTVLKTFAGRPIGITFSSDGKVLMTADDNGYFHLWPTDDSWEAKP